MNTNNPGQPDPALKRSEFYERMGKLATAVADDAKQRQVDNGAEQHTPKPSEPIDKPWINFTRLLDEAKSLELPIPKRKNGTTDTGQLEQDIAARKNGGELPAGEYAASESQFEKFGTARIVVEDVKSDPARRLSIGERVRLNRRIQQLRRHAAHKAILELRWNMHALGDPGDSPMVRHNLSVTDRFRALGGPEIMALARKFDDPNFRYVFSDHSVAPEGSVVFQ